MSSSLDELAQSVKLSVHLLLQQLEQEPESSKGERKIRMLLNIMKTLIHMKKFFPDAPLSEKEIDRNVSHLAPRNLAALRADLLEKFEKYDQDPARHARGSSLPVE